MVRPVVSSLEQNEIIALALDAVASKASAPKSVGGFCQVVSGEESPARPCRSLADPALSVVRKLASEGAENDLLDRNIAQGILSLKVTRQAGARAGNWPMREAARDLLAQPALPRSRANETG